MLNALVRLYTECTTKTVFNGNVHDGFHIKSGIKQGCPLSGTLFALALDAFIRLILSRIERPRDTLTAFADDLALVCGNMKKHLPTVMSFFTQFGRASGLNLNLAKCMYIVSRDSKDKVEETQAWLQNCLHGGAEIHVNTCGKYLGIIVGPGAYSSSWDAPLVKYRARVAAIRAESLSVMQSLMDYRTFALPVLSYIMQFQKAPTRVLKMQKHALQLILRAPYDAIPFDMLTQLRALGFHAECPDLAVANQSAMFRCASQSGEFNSLVAQMEQLHGHEDALFGNPSGEWYRHSCIGQMAENKHGLQDKIDMRLYDDAAVSLQAYVYTTVFLATPRRSVERILQERIWYWCNKFAYQATV